ncbi:MAG: N-acetylneuraminate synthase family protein [Desulfovibrio sp.]|jgi:N-acetylneuraminate synthase|nr:N-acetylneuraminate synthase family protein [Desulfovibrio sp.]
MKILEFFSTAPRGGAALVNSRGLYPPFIIAEAGVNHEGSLDIARRLIDEAREGGADAVKFQAYKAETLASKDSPAYWDTEKEPTKSQYELFRRHDKFWKNEFEALKRHCETAGIEFMSTPFDRESATFLNDLMDVFKISSSDITDKPFIRFISAFGKPVILSCGASEAYEIVEAVSWIREAGNDLALMHCVLNYPTADENAALGKICSLSQLFPDLPIGYSDHTLPGDMGVLLTAVLLGARILEKHFTHDKSLPGNDHYHAMDKTDLRNFRQRLERTSARIGGSDLRSLPSEAPARANARRSLVAAADIRAGAVISAADLTFKRPAHGLSPRLYDEIIGLKARVDIPEDSVLKWGMLTED